MWESLKSRFKEVKTLYKSETVKILKVEETSSNENFVLKLIHKKISNNNELARLRQEFKILNNSEFTHSVNCHELIEGEEGICLKLEYFDGSSLKKLIDDKPLTIARFLNIAIKCCESLQEIHSKNIIHKDIKPHNILINPDEDTVKITDFGISTFLTENLNQIYQKKTLEGTLPYIAPEQTGRINLNIDQRADIYSLGITFFELLTTGRPFNSEDPMELIHAHIAKNPQKPSSLNSEIPEILDEIILKLIAKSPQERYQSIYGLKEDLIFLNNQIIEHGKASHFELGKKDFLNKFKIPDKLYGREEQIEKLLDTFEKITMGYLEITTIQGVSGIGKSVLVNEVQKPILEKRGYFLSGKCEQFKKDVPYGILIQAFQGLFTEFLTESDEEIQKKKNDILPSLGNNGKVVTELFPLLELIIGEQPDVEALPPEASQNRFNLVFTKLLKSLATKSRPIVLFLDDMQWIDLASLELLKFIYMKEKVNFLQLIISFRDNETNPSHPLIVSLEKIKDSGITNEVIELKALEKKNIHDLIEDSVGYRNEKTSVLTDMVFSKTQGNPFFVNQLLTELGNKSIIHRTEDNIWDWDNLEVEKLEITNDVVEFMVQKINQLDGPVVETIKLAAAIGNRFTPIELYNLMLIDEDTLADHLTTANQNGLIVYKGDKYHFAHDRIQEAAYSFIPDKERSHFHYEIAKKAIKDISPEEIENKIFYLTDHLNKGKKEISNKEDRLLYINLNYKAGLRAKKSSAFTSALSYLKNSYKEISKEIWKEKYDLCFEVCNEYLEMMYLNSMYIDLEKSLVDINPNIPNTEDQTILKMNLIRAKNSQGFYEEAIDLTLESLKKLDVKINKHPSKVELLKSILLTKLKVSKLDDNKTQKLKELKDNPKILLISRLINLIFTSSYFVNQELMIILSIKIINSTLKYGITSHSSFAFSVFGIVLSAEMRDFNLAFKMGELSLKLYERYPNPKNRGLIYIAHYNLIYIWNKKLIDSIPPLEKVFHLSVELGDYESAGFQGHTVVMQKMLYGTDLSSCEILLNQYRETLKNSTQIGPGMIIKGLAQYLQNMLGKSKKRAELKGEFIDFSEFFEDIENKNDNTSSIYILNYQVMLYFLFEKFEEGFALVNYLEKYRVGAKSAPIEFLFILFESLIIYTQWEFIDNKSKKEYGEILKKNIKFFKLVSKSAPMNFNNKLYLLLAEEARVNHKYNEAIEYYNKSIEEAKENNFSLEYSLANEHLGKLYLRLNQNTKAKEYLREAHDSYMKMEAKAKAEYLEKSYPNFIQKEVNKLKLDITQTKTISQTQTYTHTHSTDSISGTGSTLTSSFDVSTILKTSQVLSGEIELKNLLKKIMKISIENAGAQRGVLLLLNDETDSFHVQAEGDSNEEYNIMQSIPLEKCTTILPVSLINYVRKSKESIVLDDASSSNLFKNDPYIVVNNSKSILCAPLKAKRKVNGIIFLENNLTTSVFTKGNLEIIKVITGQAAVSVENAFLYNNLEEKVKARTQDLQEALQEVTELKKRQDGDYYLTSLLLEPLSKNLANSEKVKIDFFLKQKKQFSFKNNTKEIGGDVNISHSIKLNGKDYTIFLNADAMGKSSQGAGGVLVFGTAFDVIIERTKKGAHISPIKWLGSAYQELHQVFLSFSGLMLMSMVLGIVEDETGLTYFMNTEHPQTVLYRNGKANFIEKKFTHYKLGSGLEEFNTDKKLIHKVQLERGDMLLMGSDGKDDVRINGVINEDETLFLKHVEDGKGDLNEIASLIINTGEITDDFSMLRVEYK